MRCGLKLDRTCLDAAISWLHPGQSRAAVRTHTAQAGSDTYAYGLMT